MLLQFKKSTWQISEDKTGDIGMPCRFSIAMSSTQQKDPDKIYQANALSCSFERENKSSPSQSRHVVVAQVGLAQGLDAHALGSLTPLETLNPS